MLPSWNVGNYWCKDCERATGIYLAVGIDTPPQFFSLPMLLLPQLREPSRFSEKLHWMLQQRMCRVLRGYFHDEVICFPCKGGGEGSILLHAKMRVLAVHTIPHDATPQLFITAPPPSRLPTNRAWTKLRSS